MELTIDGLGTERFTTIVTDCFWRDGVPGIVGVNQLSDVSNDPSESENMEGGNS